MPASSPWMPEVYTVSELSARIRQAVAGQFRDVLVEGEVSNLRLYPSGHLYFTLKDDASMIRAVVFGFALKFPDKAIRDGISVICRGRIDVYEKRGEYQLIADAIEVKGLGLLQIKFQILKEKLLKEGLFDPARKKPLPLLPKHVGIVTSPAGAAIRDMLKIIFKKFENMSVTIYPARVQGEEACNEIVEAIEYFNKAGEVDVIIVGRGGGSLEDLAAFNDEIVARAIAASNIPVISGVGHEIDYTIADFVSDLRAPTPTAAADMAITSKSELLSVISDSKDALRKAIINTVGQARLSIYRSTIALTEHKDFFTSYRMYIDDLTTRLSHSLTLYIDDRAQRLKRLRQRLADLNPDNILKRGYSITMKEDTREIVLDASSVEAGEELIVKLSRGQIGVRAKGKIRRT